MPFDPKKLRPVGQPAPAPATAAQGGFASKLNPAPATPAPSPLEGASNFISDSTPDAFKPAVKLGTGILGAMTTSMRKFGATLGTTAAAMTGATDQIDEANIAEADSRTRLTKLLDDPKVSEEQKRHIRAQLGQDFVKTAGETVDLKSTKQVIGEGLGTAAEVASILAIGKLKGGKELSTAVAESLPRSFATQFPNVARYLGYAGTGALFGGTAAAGKSLQKDSDMKTLARDTAWGSTIGALTNVAIPAALEGSAFLYRKTYETFSGVPKEAVDKLIDNPSDMLGRLAKAGKDPAQAQSDILQTFDDGVNAVKSARARGYEASLTEVGDRTIVSTFDPNDLLSSSPLGESEKQILATRMSELADEADAAAEAIAKKYGKQLHPSDFANLQAPYLEQAEKYREAAKLAVTDPSMASRLDPEASVWWKGDDGRWTETNLSPSSVKGNFTKLLNDFKFRRTNGLWSVGQADVPASYIPKINELNSRIQTWDDFTPAGFNQLRRVISSYDDGTNPAFSKIVGKLAEQTEGFVNKNAPEVISGMNADYAVKSKVLDRLKREIGSTESNQQMKINRIIGLFKPNSVYRKSLIDELGEDKADELLSQVSAYILSQAGPQGTIRRGIELLGAGGAVAAGFFNPSLWAFLPAAALASPRVGATITAPAAAAGKTIFDIAKRVGPTAAAQAGESKVE